MLVETKLYLNANEFITKENERGQRSTLNTSVIRRTYSNSFVNDEWNNVRGYTVCISPADLSQVIDGNWIAVFLLYSVQKSVLKKART